MDFRPKFARKDDDPNGRCTRGLVFSLVQALTGAHGTLDVERPDVLPILLEERDEEIDGETDVGRQVVGLHGHVADGDGQAKHLLRKGKLNTKALDGQRDPCPA